MLPPDVNASDYMFTPVRDTAGDAIRFGLGAVKNVGQGAVDAIIRARTELGQVHVDLPVLRARRYERDQSACDRESD